MTNVTCPNCQHDVELPSGLALSGQGDNPDWKVVSCPWCDEGVIDADDVKAAFGGGIDD